MYPKVAIVGRPNVGKSSLLNTLAGRRISIVDAQAGVTRDRVSALAELPAAETNGPPRYCELVDTGGYGIYSGSDEEDLAQLTRDVERQIDYAVDEADLILLVVDARAGITPLDEQFARTLRQRGEALKRLLLVANKVDDEAHAADAMETTALGLGDPICISTTTGFGKFDLKEAIAACLDFSAAAEREPESEMRLAIVGKRNAGKSTLVNTLAGSQRVIAHELAGTTRDSVDVRFEMDGRTFTAIDTAGLRRRRSVKNDVEYYSTHRALRAVRSADVCMLLIDAAVPVSKVDKQLSQEIAEHYKPCIIAVNKWNLVSDRVEPDDYIEYLNDALRGLTISPIAFISAETGEGVPEAVATCCELHRQAGEQLTTSQLNKLIKQFLEDRGPTPRLGAEAKIYYATQVGTHPPTIALFVNDPDLFDQRYQRYLINRFRETTPFEEVPIKLQLRARRPATTPG